MMNCVAMLRQSGYAEKDEHRQAKVKARRARVERAKARDAPAAKAPEEPPARKGWGWPWS